MRTRTSAVAIAATLVLVLAGCDGPAPTPPALNKALPLQAIQTTAQKELDIALCASTRGGFSTVSTNPYFPMDVGRQLILTGEEGGESIKMQFTVLNVTRLIQGVRTRVIEEREWVDGVLSEVTWNYHVQAVDGTICYYGEDVDVYGDAGITHDGAWCPGGANRPGIFMPADPRPGMTYQNEVAPGIALDEARIVGYGPTEVPFGRFTETIRIREFDPLTGAKDHKVHAAGVGIIVDGILQLEDINQTSGAPEQPSLTLLACGTQG